MKNVLFVILLSLISFNSSSQMIARTYKNCAGSYDEYFKKWRFDDYKYANIDVRVEKGFMQFDDAARSLYRVVESQGEKTESTYKATSWLCLDERNMNCIIQIIHYFEDKSNVITVIYNKVCYVYYIKTIDDYSLKQ